MKEYDIDVKLCMSLKERPERLPLPAQFSDIVKQVLKLIKIILILLLKEEVNQLRQGLESAKNHLMRNISVSKEHKVSSDTVHQLMTKNTASIRVATFKSLKDAQLPKNMNQLPKKH